RTRRAPLGRSRADCDGAERAAVKERALSPHTRRKPGPVPQRLRWLGGGSRLSTGIRPFVIGLCLAAGINSAAAADLPKPWVELAADGRLSVRAVIGPGVACPAMTADGAIAASSVRAAPDNAFPVQVCEARAPAATARLDVGGIALPVMAPTVQRIAVIGDTGCQLAGRAAQDCRDAA